MSVKAGVIYVILIVIFAVTIYIIDKDLYQISLLVLGLGTISLIHTKRLIERNNGGRK